MRNGDKGDKKDIFMNVIKGRRSVRCWDNIYIDDKDVKYLIDAARWAPSTGNKQAIKFLIVTNSKKRLFLSQVVAGGIGFSSNAPMHILVLIDSRAYLLPAWRHMMYLDAGAAIQNLILAAYNIGISTCWLNWDGSISINSEKIVYERFSIPDYYLITSLVLVGKSSVSPIVPPRKKIDEFIMYESFKGK